MTIQASGTFTVKLGRQDTETEAQTGLGRMIIDKQFQGPLEAVSKGQMIAAGTDVKGSAGYVAIERVTGSLEGKTGSFLLQHSGLMNRGVGELIIRVVPDSGSGELMGISGTMGIDIVDGQHFYRFDYTLGT
ncbi:MAG: DUF3224 domain-containing protein [Polyangiales bacterium]